LPAVDVDTREVVPVFLDPVTDVAFAQRNGPASSAGQRLYGLLA
jgi:hypothetical protein